MSNLSMAAANATGAGSAPGQGAPRRSGLEVDCRAPDAHHSQPSSQQHHCHYDGEGHHAKPHFP